MGNETQIQALQTGHVGLNVSDIGRSKSFYQELLVFGSCSNRRLKAVSSCF